MEKNKYLHFNTTFESPLAYKDHYYDITNSDLCVWSLNDFTLINCYPKISQAYYIKLRIISDDILIIAQNDIIKIFNLKQGRVVEKIQEKDFIENLETQPSQGVVVTVVAGLDEKTKIVTKWALKDNTLVKVGSVNVVYDDDISEATFSLFVFSSGKIYLYKIESDIMFQVVVQENEFKKNTVPITTSVVLQLENQKNFAVAQEGKISINDPVKGSVYGSIECEGEIYSVILELPGQDSLITSSNKALKLWFLQSKTEPKIFQKSQKMLIDKLLIHGKQLIGLSTKTKTLAIWNIQTQELIKQQKICRQQIQKSFKIAQKYICLVVKVFDETEESLTFHHRLELVEISTDKIISSKQVKNASYLIEVETLIPVDNQTIRFICSADKGDKLKSYLFSWKPFSKEQKKNMSKIQLSKSTITKLYPYDRLLLAAPPKEKTQVYTHFTASQHITAVYLYTHALKQIVTAKLEGYFDDIEVDRNDKIYGIKPQSISVFALNNKSNGLQKLNSFELEVTNIFFAGSHILCINKQNDRCLYDNNFELIMKQQGQGQGIIDILQVDKTQLIISSSQSIEVWDIQKQQVQNHKMQLEIIGACLQAPGELLITQSDRIQRFNIKNL